MIRTALLLLLAPALWSAPYTEEIRTVHLQGQDIRNVWIDATGSVFARTATTTLRFNAGQWTPVTATPPDNHSARARDGRVAEARPDGLFLNGQRLFPRAGNRSWAPVDVRGVAFDLRDRLWFASPQGVGVLDGQTWTLYTGADGLPYDDLSSVAASPDGSVWFGTHIGAIRFDGKTWAYRQGRRWLPADDVRAIAVEPGGHAWIATAQGLSRIERRSTTLADKARFFEDEIDRRHRRTPYGYVLEVQLKRPGDLSEWTQHDSDNDGLWTAMYGAGECFAVGATNDEAARRRAKAAFEALRFLGTVTQGGEHAPPRGFVARSILPTDGPNPNRDSSKSNDLLWKNLVPRWPVSADGKWYWKADTSSDELDGHYFFYGVYYDLVARTDEEKQAVRDHVAALTDHLVDHGFQLIDHDGKPTRWGIFDPANLNGNVNFWAERGVNSLSMLSYLKVAGHITGDPKYEQAYQRLIKDHAYDSNVIIPKSNGGPGSGNQSDDEMIFMNYYGLLRYEKDPALRTKYLLAFSNHWQMEVPERNPFFAYLYAAIATGERYRDAFEDIDLTPSAGSLSDALDTLQRYPRDRVEWGFRNSHRKDLLLLEPGRGTRLDHKVLPIDERYVNHWNLDPWRLDQNANGRTLGDGASFLLPYYLGLYLKKI